MALAEATVRVTLDVSQFERELRQKVTQAANRAAKDFDKEMKGQLGKTGKDASASFGTAARAGMLRAGRDAASGFDASFQQGMAQSGGKAAQKLSQGLRIQVTRAGADAGRGFTKNVDSVLTAAGTATGARFVDALTQGILRGGARTGAAVGNSISSGSGSAAATAGRNAGRQFSLNFGVGSASANKGLIAGIAVLGSALIESVRPALSIVAALPGLLFATATAAGVTVAAFQGIGDAVKAVAEGDIDKINTAMAKLSPQAQGFVRDFAAVRPVLHGVQQDIQDAFFGQVQGQITSLGAALSGPLRAGLVQVATSAGVLTRNLAEAFTSPRGAQNLAKLFGGTSDFLDQLTPGLRRVTQGMLDFVGASAPGLSSIGIALSDLLSKFGDFLTTSAQSGKALEWIEGGITGLRNLATEINQLVDALGIILAAARPLSFALAGLLDVAESLIGVFGLLPGPLQTAALAAALFVASGLPTKLRDANREAGPLSRTISEMGQSFQTTNAQVRQMAVVSTATSAATSALGRAVDGTAASVNRLGRQFGQGLLTGAGALDTAVGRVSTTLQTGFIRGTVAANSAIESTASALRNGLTQGATLATRALERTAVAIYDSGTAMRTGIARGAIETNAALARLTDRAEAARDVLRGGLIPTALAIDSATTRAQAGISNLATSMQSRLVVAATATRTAVAGASDALQNGFIRAAVASNTALNSVGTSLRNGVLAPLVQAQAVYRNTATSVRDFTTATTALNTPLGQSPGLVNRVRDAFSGLTASTAGTAAVLGAGFSKPLAAIGTGMDTLAGKAVGLGKSLATGLGNAVSGLTAALGGPWGVAIAAAGALLAVFSSSQQEAAAAAAKHGAAVSTLASTLDKTTGAVTAATRATVIDTATKDGSIAAAAKLGVSSGQLADALTGQGTALAQVRQRMADVLRPTIEANSEFRQTRERAADAGITLDLLSQAASGNKDAMKAVNDANSRAGGSYNKLISEVGGLTGEQKTLLTALHGGTVALDAASEANRRAAAATTPAQVAAQKYADALLVLRDRASDADSKARALSEALNILAGGTVNAEVAQARFTDLLAQLDAGLVKSTEGLQGMGAGLITNTGHINTQTTAGSFLVGTYKQLSDSLTTSAAATIQAGQANGDLDGALITVAQQAQAARDQFIQTAGSLGLNKDQANRLADAYGLIPANVLTTVTDAGSAHNVELQVVGVFQQLKNLPPNTPITVQGLTEDAIKKLNEVGVKTETLPDGTVKVTAETQDATSRLQGLINSFSGRVINFVANILGGNAMGNIVPNARGNIIGYANGGTHMRKMSANRAEIVPPKTMRVIGDRARDDEAYIPINSSARSRSLLATTANRMDFDLVPRGRAITTRPEKTISVGTVMVNAPYADPELVAKATMNEIARQAVN